MQNPIIKSLKLLNCNRSVLRALLIGFNVESGIAEYLFPDEESRKDCCRWIGVECTDGFVTTLVSPVFRYGAFYMHMQWLPQTIAYLHAVVGKVEGHLAIEQLPRNLRYFFLFAPEACATGTDVLNFEKLPHRLEELWMTMTSSVSGTVYVPSLPSKMRVCLLQSSTLQTVLICNSGIPESLERFALLNKKVKIHCIDDKNVDKRVRKVDGTYPAFKSYFTLGKHAMHVSETLYQRI